MLVRLILAFAWGILAVCAVSASNFSYVESPYTMGILLKNNANVVKNVPTGFSWTVLFFGCFVPLFRGDIKWFIAMLILAIITSGLSWLVLPFTYNKSYIKGLLEHGFVPADAKTKKYLEDKGIIDSY